MLKDHESVQGQRSNMVTSCFDFFYKPLIKTRIIIILLYKCMYFTNLNR